MTDIPVKFQFSDLADELWKVLQGFEETHSSDEVVRAAGEVVGTYLLVCGLKGGDNSAPMVAFSAAMTQSTLQFAAGFTETYIAIKGERN